MIEPRRVGVSRVAADFGSVYEIELILETVNRQPRDILAAVTATERRYSKTNRKRMTERRRRPVRSKKGVQSDEKTSKVAFKGAILPALWP